MPNRVALMRFMLVSGLGAFGVVGLVSPALAYCEPTGEPGQMASSEWGTLDWLDGLSDDKLVAVMNDDDNCNLPPITVTPPSGGGGGFIGGPPGGGGGGGSCGGGESCGGGGGGSAGQLPHVGPELENNPQNTETGANCTSLHTIRKNYANQEIGWNRNRSFAQGNGFRPAPGEAYTIRFLNGQRESYVAGPLSTSVGAGVPIDGTCW